MFFECCDKDEVMEIEFFNKDLYVVSYDDVVEDGEK